MKNFKAQLAIAIICILLGFMISIQLKSVKENQKLTTSYFQRADELQIELTKERDKNERINQQLLQYEKDLNAMQQAASDKSGYAKELMDQLKRTQVLAGLTDVEGKGIIVTLDDSKIKNEGEYALDNNTLLIHDQDILIILNELADAGAEALSLNDERILGTSEIRCAGATVSVNNNRYAPPFIIKAIGNPDTLEAALNLRGGVRDILLTYGFEFNVKKSDKILIPRYKGAISFKYAVPVEKGGGSQ